jgi:hypothetical protein
VEGESSQPDERHSESDDSVLTDSSPEPVPPAYEALEPLHSQQEPPGPQHEPLEPSQGHLNSHLQQGPQQPPPQDPPNMIGGGVTLQDTGMNWDLLVFHNDTDMLPNQARVEAIRYHEYELGTLLDRRLATRHRSSFRHDIISSLLHILVLLFVLYLFFFC